MHAVIRTYSGSGATELFDLLERRKSEVEGLMRPIPGFASYHLIKTRDGGTSVTVCQTKAGTDESLKKAKDWIAANASGIHANAPTVLEGPVIVHLSAQDSVIAQAAAPVHA
jgi:hypothetical protein